jgi:hypothetical protein
LVKEILVAGDKIIIRHCIPLLTRPGGSPPATNGHAALGSAEGYLLRSRGRNRPLHAQHLHTSASDGWCPASEVRDPLRHPLTRTSEAKGH